MFLWELSMFHYTTAQKTTCQSSVYVWNTNEFTPDHRPATSHHRSSDQTPTKRSRPPVDVMESWLEIHWSVVWGQERGTTAPRHLQLGKNWKGIQCIHLPFLVQIFQHIGHLLGHLASRHMANHILVGWFQPLWKMLVNMGIIPPVRGENENIFETTT